MHESVWEVSNAYALEFCQDPAIGCDAAVDASRFKELLKHCGSLQGCFTGSQVWARQTILITVVEIKRLTGLTHRPFVIMS